MSAPRPHPKRRRSRSPMPTGVQGLDDLLRGGIVLPASGENLVVLIKGAPGTGKTTLALQMFAAAANWKHRRAKRRYETLEQHSKDIKNTLKRLGANDALDDLDATQEIVGREGDNQTGKGPFLVNSPVVHATLEILRKLAEPKSKRFRLLVIDGLNLLGPEEMKAADIGRLVRIMRSKADVGVLVLESDLETSGTMDYQCDMVIALKGEVFSNPLEYYLNHLNIQKSRFQQSALGWHQYKIRGTGLIVFPSTHFRLHKHKGLADRLEDSKKRITELDTDTGRAALLTDKSLISRLLNPHPKAEGGVKRGSCTVLLGPRRSLKTQLTFDFLRAGSTSRRPQVGLLASLIDNQGTIIGQRSCLCERDCLDKIPGAPTDCDHIHCYRRVYLLHFPPGCVTTSEFFDCLENRFRHQEKEKAPVKRFVFWDLAQLEYRFPLLHADPMFLPGLFDYLKYSKGEGEDAEERQIASVFMGAPNMAIARAASAMADNVLFCWQDEEAIEAKPKRGIAIYVDRIEGHPGENYLHFIPEPNEPTTEKVPKLSPKEVEEKALTKARRMIASIKRLQGL